MGLPDFKKGVAFRRAGGHKSAHHKPGAGVPYYDSSATFDGGLLYDDPSSPQPTKHKMAKLKLSLDRLTPDEVLALATTMKTSFTGNANFPTPNPTLAAFATLITTAQTGINDYNASVATSQAKLLTRDTGVAALENGMRLLVSYAENTSGGDPVKLATTGVPLRDAPSAVGPLGQVLNLVVTAGDNDGSLDVAWDRERGASGYEIQVSVDPVTGTSWTFKMNAGKSSATLLGLTSGTKQWVRVRAFGANNATGPWSDPAVKTVP